MEKRKKLWIIAAAIFLILALIGIGIFLRNQNNKEDEASCNYNGTTFKVGQKFRDNKNQQICECNSEGLKCEKIEAEQEDNDEEVITPPSEEVADPVVYQVYTNPDYKDLRLKYPDNWEITVEEGPGISFDLPDLKERTITLTKGSSILTVKVSSVTTFGFAGVTCYRKDQSDYKYIGNEFTRSSTADLEDADFGYSSLVMSREFQTDQFNQAFEPNDIYPPIEGTKDDYNICSAAPTTTAIIALNKIRTDVEPNTNYVVLASISARVAPENAAEILEELDQIILDSTIK